MVALRFIDHFSPIPISPLRKGTVTRLTTPVLDFYIWIWSAFLFCNVLIQDILFVRRNMFHVKRIGKDFLLSYNEQSLLYVPRAYSLVDNAQV